MTTTVLLGGRMIDPQSGLDAVGDVVVRDGVIASVGPAGSFSGGVPGDAEILDVSGHLVVPGLIDLHAHVMPGLGDFCVEADAAGVDRGVPTVVDGGTSGVATFDLARRAVIDHPDTVSRALAFIDPNQLYLATRDFICHRLEIANDERNIDLAVLEASLERNADVVVGLKVRACFTTDPEASPFLRAAKQAAGHLPIMVHLGRFPFTPTIPITTLLRELRAGDIVTHAFRGASGVLDASGRATPELRDAVARGVRLDVGHSGTDFRFRDARRLFDQGYLPHTVSTDLNVFNIDGPVFSLAETLSKVWALGVDLSDVIAMATVNTASTIGRAATLGALAVGRAADVSVLGIGEGEHVLTDGHEAVTVERWLAPAGCVRAGTWHPARSTVAA